MPNYYFKCLFFLFLSPGIIATYSIIWFGLSLWLAWVSFPGCVPYQLLTHLWPTCWKGTVRNREAPEAMKTLFSNNKHGCIVDTVWGRNPNISTIQSCKENSLHPRQNHTSDYLKEMLVLTELLLPEKYISEK